VSGFSRTCLPATLAIALTACHPSPHAVRLKPDTAVTRLQHDVNAILAAPALEHGYWGVVVNSLTTGETLYAVNPHKLMMPASNMKIVTLAAAADRLGWNYRYETEIRGLGAINMGSLDGDLLVIGSGDPSIVAADGMADRLFAGWAERLKAIGVHTITGRIVGDDNTFDDEPLGMGWSWDDLADGYAAGISALQFNEGEVRVTIAPGAAEGDPPEISIVPAGSGLRIRNLLKTSAAGTATSVATRRLPGSAQLELRGTVPVGSTPSAHACSVDNQTQFFVNALRIALIANGIDVKGEAVDIDDVSDAPSREQAMPLLAYRSPPLSELAGTLMKISLNFDAETFVKTMGAVDGVPTFDAGRTATRAILQRWGVPAAGVIYADGSGLSRYNYVTPDALVAILTHVNHDEQLRGPFEAALPVAGKDGTLANRMKGTAAQGNARAKTGSMSNVRGLSGYVTTADGEPLVFSILANNFETAGDVVNKASDAIVVRLAQFRRLAADASK
jgi:D-alanyl-D-alanine carboxypeptidase/D-alanyl-D-alanine-endopeptidase (penicillin-binding protein 4)